MKKNYMAPEMSVETLEVINMIALSAKNENADGSPVLTESFGDFSEGEE